VPSVTGKCPNPDCRTTLTGGSDVERFRLTSTSHYYLHAIVCKACGVVIGMTQEPKPEPEPKQKRLPARKKTTLRAGKIGLKRSRSRRA
jgi:hypothetical protein